MGVQGLDVNTKSMSKLLNEIILQKNEYLNERIPELLDIIKIQKNAINSKSNHLDVNDSISSIIDQYDDEEKLEIISSKPIINKSKPQIASNYIFQKFLNRLSSNGYNQNHEMMKQQKIKRKKSWNNMSSKQRNKIKTKKKLNLINQKYQIITKEIALMHAPKQKMFKMSSNFVEPVGFNEIQEKGPGFVPVPRYMDVNNANIALLNFGNSIRQTFHFEDTKNEYDDASNQFDDEKRDEYEMKKLKKTVERLKKCPTKWNNFI